jgi:phosphatidylglycerol lysyltransferase
MMNSICSNSVIDVMRHSEHPVSEHNLALTGDKEFFFSESGRTFIMYGVRGKTWIALGAPIGLVNEAAPLIDEFLEAALAANAMPAFYAVRERYCRSFEGMGLRRQKIGEMALISLNNFSLSGKDKARYRQSRNRAIREGLSFEVLRPSEYSPMMDRLEFISNDWLRQQQGQEKGFSLGRFDRKTLAQQPIAVARKNGEIIAFSNLWSSADGKELSLDLMRYQDDVMVGVIDYVLVEAMIWGSAQGYEAFSLGMAPLAGLEGETETSIMTYLCRMAFKHGDRLYGFKGIRQFKKKFNPEWEAVYLLAPKQRHMPRALRDLALLSAGGYKGLFKRAA